MKILFVHQNFPGQFAHLAPALVAAGHEVAALSSRFEAEMTWRGVTVHSYPWTPPEGQKHHPWLTTMNTAVHRGTAAYRAALALRNQGYVPDVIVAHSGWGEALYLGDVWPEARTGVFCEFFYRGDGADIGFDPEFEQGEEIGRVHRMDMKNLAMRMQLERADAGISPTRWQAAGWPKRLARRISIVHDGIDTAAVAPARGTAASLPGGPVLGPEDEVVTFVNRNLEPYRGFHIFMRALPDLLKRRPKARVVIVGDDGVSYGAGPRNGGTWKQAMIDEVRGRIPTPAWNRVHFTGRVPRTLFLEILQVSRVHVYLTYPFVLSWSLMEAMACECAIVASDTAPVREVLEDGRTALLHDFFDGTGMVDRIERLCGDADLRRTLGRAARRHVRTHYDLSSVCLPRQFEWIDGFSGQPPLRGVS